jgi:hypothetical protein
MTEGGADGPGGWRPVRLADDLDPRTRRLVDHWAGLTETGLPARRHFDPLDVPDLLGNIWILEVVWPGPCFRYRLFGTRVSERLGNDLTGRWLEEVIPGVEQTHCWPALQRVALEGEAMWRRGPPVVVHEDDDVREIEVTLLPLASDGGTVDMILAMTLHHTEDALAAAQ